MIFINCLRQYNEIHVITKPSSSTCQVCVSAVRGGCWRYSTVNVYVSITPLFDNAYLILSTAVCRTVVILNSVVGVGSQVFAIQE